jgi:hypothetical protein
MTLEFWTSLIALAVPILISLTKLLLPSIPKVALPILAPILGAALAIVGYYTGLMGESHPLIGALLGAVGVWLREVVDQLKKLGT